MPHNREERRRTVAQIVLIEETSTGARISGGLYLTPWRRSPYSSIPPPLPQRRSPPAALSCPMIGKNTECRSIPDLRNGQHTDVAASSCTQRHQLLPSHSHRT
jgi:hypothetical protein